MEGVRVVQLQTAILGAPRAHSPCGPPLPAGLACDEWGWGCGGAGRRSVMCAAVRESECGCAVVLVWERLYVLRRVCFCIFLGGCVQVCPTASASVISGVCV